MQVKDNYNLYKIKHVSKDNDVSVFVNYICIIGLGLDHNPIFDFYYKLYV